MLRVRLIQWRVAEVHEQAARIQSAGYAVECAPLTPEGLRALRENPPGAIVIDLSRAPAQGRDLGLNLRKYKATRHVPIVFVNGAPEKVARVQGLLPDAVYTSWDDVGDALRSATSSPPANPVVPDSTMAGYAGTPLPKKLGIKPHSTLALEGAPAGFERALGDLPEGVDVSRSPGAPAQVTLWFVASQQDLKARIEGMFPAARNGGLWIIWPKKTSGIVSDLSQSIVRETGLAAGLVDFKVAAIDETWSGLRFSQRKARSQT